MNYRSFTKANAFALVFLTFVLIWEYFSLNTVQLQFILPAPSKILSTLWERQDRFFIHSLATIKEMAGGALVAIAVAFPVAWLMASYWALRTILQPFFIAVQCIPIFVLAPLMVLWFGWSIIAIIVPTALMIFFPLTITIYQGLHSIPSSYLEFFRRQSATPWQIFYKLQLPWALPHIFSGLRIIVALAGLGAVVGEWAGAQEGLGILMLETRRSADIETMFGAVVCIMSITLFLYMGVSFLERLASRRYYRLQTPLKLICILMASLVLGGCREAPQKPETTLVLDWLPNPNHIPIYAGIERGLFKEQGIDLRVLKISDPSDSVPYLTSRQADLSLTYMPHTIHAQTHGAKVIPIGILVQEPLNSIIFRKNEGILSPKDLNNKTIGYCIDGYNTAFIHAMLSPQNIQPGDLVNVSFDLVSTLATKQVDVIYGAYWNIECENLRAKGMETNYFTLGDFAVPTYYELIFLANENSQQTSEPFIRAFQNALQSSIDFSIAHPDEAFEDYLKANPDKSLATQQWERLAWYQTIPTLAKQQQIDPMVWNQFIDWLREQGLL